MLIAGGGLAGSVLAALLSRAGLRVLILEPRQPPGDAEETGTDPRALAVTPAS
ncbi:MAG: NAD(P)-binding protein, partial [Gammaproteobacteria bacterium]